MTGTKDMLLGWSMPSRDEDGGWFSPCMLWFRSMVPVAGTKDMLLGWSMASRRVDVARFIAGMLWYRSMVLVASTTDMLRGRSMVAHATGRCIPHYCEAMTAPCDPDRGHTNSFFSLMLGLIILGAAGMSQCDAPGKVHFEEEELVLSSEAMNIYSLGTNMSLPSNTAHIDSGTTRHASGCRGLFPEHLIAVRKPQLSVPVASGSRLPVEFIGVMQLHVQGTIPKGESQGEQRVR